MADFQFIDKYGRIFYAELSKSVKREADYIIVKHENKILCFYDEEKNIFVLPREEDVRLNIQVSSEFSVVNYIYEDENFIKEQQNYKVYEVENVDVSHIAMFWCSINDILLEKTAFDATQKCGLKNLWVRSLK